MHLCRYSDHRLHTGAVSSHRSLRVSARHVFLLWLCSGGVHHMHCRYVRHAHRWPSTASFVTHWPSSCTAPCRCDMLEWYLCNSLCLFCPVFTVLATIAFAFLLLPMCQYLTRPCSPQNKYEMFTNSLTCQNGLWLTAFTSVHMSTNHVSLGLKLFTYKSYVTFTQEKLIVSF